MRQAKSKPILEDIHAYLEREQLQVLPKSPEGQAIAYTLSNWKALTRYCEDGDLEIDNNGAERSLRGVAIGRKNWMFYGSDEGGRTAAVLTTLIATCKRLHIDPLAYLRDLFGRIAAHPKARIAELLPDRWKAATPAAPHALTFFPAHSQPTSPTLHGPGGELVKSTQGLKRALLPSLSGT